MGATFFVLAAVEFTIGQDKTRRAFLCRVRARGWTRVPRLFAQNLGPKNPDRGREVADMVSPEKIAAIQPCLAEGQKIMVAARGITPVLSFALEEAQLRKAVLCVVFVKEVSVYFSDAATALGRARWQDDPEAQAIMSLMFKLGAERGISVLPVYAVSPDAATTIIDLTATLGVDCLILGATHRSALTNLLRGSVVTNVAQQLPDSIRLIIFG